MTDLYDRACGALYGMAIGDALGMPTQSLSPEVIEAIYPDLSYFVAGADIQPYAPGLPAGTVTDDTEQALIVADLLIAHDGHVPAQAMADALLAWEADMLARGSHDLLGPSTKAALSRVAAGEDPTTTGTTGITNGAAMRVAPVGLAYSLDSAPEALFNAVYESCLVTHNTRQGFTGAALVAAAVSAGLDQQGFDGEAVRNALSAACREVGELEQTFPRGEWAEGASVLARTSFAMALATGYGSMDTVNSDDFASTLRDVVGTSVAMSESVPAAFAIAWVFADDPVGALLFSARLGGDTDTIGAIVGAILGAALGVEAFPEAMRMDIDLANGLDVASRAERLVSLRLDRMSPREWDEADPELAAWSQGFGRYDRPSDQPMLVWDGPSQVGGSLVVVGQAIVDMTMRVEKWPEVGGDVFASAHELMVGGAFNAMYAARQVGAPVQYYGAVGQGPMSDAVLGALDRHGIFHFGPCVEGLDTGYCVAVTDAAGERTFLSTIGAETRIDPADWCGIVGAPDDVVYIDGYSLYHASTSAAVAAFAADLHQAMDEATRDESGEERPARRVPRAVYCDVGPMVGEASVAVLSAVAALRPVWGLNARELRIFVERLRTEDGWVLPGCGAAAVPSQELLDAWGEDSSGGDEAAAAQCVAQLSEALGGPVIVRRGPRGAVAAVEGAVMSVSALPVEVCDTNGAGDTFAGVLCASLAQGRTWEDALRWASAAASLSVSEWGPATCPAVEVIAQGAQQVTIHHTST